MNEDNTYLDGIADMDAAEFFGDEPADERPDEPAAEEPQEEPAADGQAEQEESPAEADPEEEYELNTGIGTRKVNRKELLELAGKGQLASALTQQVSELQEQLAEGAQHRYDAEDLAELAKEAGMDVPAFLDALRENALVQRTGMTRAAAKEEVRKQREAKDTARQEEKNKQQAAAAQRREAESRARRDLADFQRLFPGVNHQDPQQVPNEVWNEVLSGRETLTNAYGQYRMQQQAAEIQRLQEAAAAKAKNDSNKEKSVGSVRTAGAARTGDDFLDGFNA